MFKITIKDDREIVSFTAQIAHVTLGPHHPEIYLERVLFCGIMIDSIVMPIRWDFPIDADLRQMWSFVGNKKLLLGLEKI